MLLFDVLACFYVFLTCLLATIQIRGCWTSYSDLFWPNPPSRASPISVIATESYLELAIRDARASP